MQKPYFYIAKTPFLRLKNHTFTLQKTPFCDSKTILLFCDYVTYKEWTRCEHSEKYQRTPTKTPNEHSIKYPHPTTKCTTNTPPGVGADLSRPYPCITKYAFSHYQIHIFISLHTHIRSSFCGYIRICGHDKSAPTAANGLPTTLLANWNNVANMLWDIHIQPRNAPRTHRQA